MKIKELIMGQRAKMDLLLLKAESKTGRNGKEFCTLFLTDGEHQITANKWDTSASAMADCIQHVVSVWITAGMYNGALSYTVDHCVVSLHGDVADFVLKAPLPAEQMYQRILGMLEKTKTSATGPAALAIRIYQNNKEKLLYWAAGKSMHHNIYAGLLYHVYRMMQAALMMAKIYPVNTELLLAGTALHDIGKLAELETDPLGTASYTTDGTLFGHALLGIEMIDQEVAAVARIGIQFDVEGVRLLKHLLASHHGTLEWGAITQPAIPEAMILHHLDSVDARMYGFEEAYKTLEPGQVAEQANFPLGGIRPYRAF